MITIPFTLETKQQLSIKPQRKKEASWLLRLKKPTKNEIISKKHQDCQNSFKKMQKLVKC